MKKLFLLIAFFSLTLSMQAQVFNTGKLLKQGSFGLGINPAIYSIGNSRNTVMNIHGGYGLSRFMDVAVRYIVQDGSDYIGADFEWLIKKGYRMDVSLVTGAHVQDDMGLDGTLCLSFPITDYATFFTGVDVDLELENDLQHYTWLPIGVEVDWRNRVSVILEGDIPMSEWAWSILTGGIMIYF